MEINPHHPTTKAMHDHWHKIAALLMLKFKSRHVVLTASDVQALTGENANIVIQELPDGLHVRLVDDKEASRLAKRHGGKSLS